MNYTTVRMVCFVIVLLFNSCSKCHFVLSLITPPWKGWCGALPLLSHICISRDLYLSSRYHVTYHLLARAFQLQADSYAISYCIFHAYSTNISIWGNTVVGFTLKLSDQGLTQGRASTTKRAKYIYPATHYVGLRLQL